MKRCNTKAYRYSWFNGFRLCEGCYSKADRKAVEVMVTSPEAVGPCDQPIETKAEFLSRMGEGVSS